METIELLECLSAKDDTETFLARRKADDLLCVVKQYKAGSLLYDFTVPEAVRQLAHPGIPRFLEEGKNGRYRFEVREYVPGTPLSELRRGSLSEQEIISLGCRLCDILSYLHHLPDPVIHRDIKPANLILSDNGQLSLIDFGIARTRHDSPESADTVICGTKEFCAPEQFGFMQTDARADIYSFGKLLEWLSPSPSAPLAFIIAKCTRFDPSGRYSSIDRVHRALLRLTPGYRAGLQKKLLTAALFLLVCLGAFLFLNSVRVRFREPLIEQAVRQVLQRPARLPVFPGDLDRMEYLFIAENRVFTEEEEFYRYLDFCYEEGRIPSGTLVSITDCASMLHLKKLCIAGESISDLSPVSNLAELEKLELKHNLVTDISPLAGLTGLASVGLNGNPVTDLSVLRLLPGLRYLDLCEANHYDASVFSVLDDFEYLDIDNRTQSYRYLPGKRIRCLRLGAIHCKDLNFLLEIEGLEEVRLNNSIEHYRKIQELGPVDFKVIYE